MPIPFTGYAVPHIVLFFLILFALWLIIYFNSRKLLCWALPHLSPKDVKKLKMAGFTTWILVFTTACVIWCFTVSRVDHSSPSEIFFRIVGAAFVLLLVMFLEGIELALVELADKEIEKNQEFAGCTQALRLIHDFEEDAEAYLRAREWCFALLIIAITLLVEFDVYFVPFLGSFEGELARVVMTVLLATIAVIWMAQAPGKELGRRTPVKFLDLRFFPIAAHKLILKLRDWTARSFINEPSDITATGMKKLFKLTQETQLPPGSTRFFTELIRKYGYADCDVEEEIVLKEDGSCTFTQREVVYIHHGANNYRRKMKFDSALRDLPKVTCTAQIVSSLESRIDVALEQWKTVTNRVIPDWRIRINRDWLDSTRTLAVTDVRIKDLNLKPGEGVLLTVISECEISAKAFRGPASPGKDSWERVLSKPCYRAKTIVRMHHSVAVGRFFHPRYSVTVDKKYHESESTRFGVNQQDPVATDGRTLTTTMLYGLPGATYTIQWYMDR